jgi:hypothetical protein
MPRNTAKKGKKPAALSPCYVPCRVAPGMFRQEYLVYLDAAAPHNPNETAQAQLFVDEREVSNIDGIPNRDNPVPAWLCVTLIGQGNGWAEVVLPQPSQPFGERVLVASQTVKESPGP